MAYITIQINAASLSVAGDSTKPREIVQNVQNVLDGIKSGELAASVSISSSTVAGTVSGQTGGVAAITLNLA
jgi:broad specificity polyphosphatase/5'/3'-nucleotidase SurE